LRRFFSEVLRAIDDFVHAVSDTLRRDGNIGHAPTEQQEEQKPPEPPSPPSPTRIELQVPEALSAQFEATANAQKELNARVFQNGRIAIVIAAACLVFLIVYATLTFGLWQAQIESNNEQRKALEVANRAYLSLGPLESQEIGTFALPVFNGGHIPANYSITLNFTRQLLDQRHRPIGKPLVGNLESPGNGTVQPGSTNYIIIGLLTGAFSPRERTSLLRGYENASLKITLTYDTGFGYRDRISTVACFFEPQGGLRWNQLCGASNTLDLGRAAKYHNYKEDPAN
jgi:hypothetical protein